MSNRMKEEPRKLELISLVDVVFLLLIFFLVTLNFGNDQNKKKDENGIFEGSLLDVKMPEIQNKNLKTAQDSLVICLNVEQDSIRCYFIDSSCQNIAQIQSKIVTRLMVLQGIPHKSIDEISEGRNLYRAWHSHVVTQDGIDLNNWTTDNLRWYHLPMANAIGMSGQFKQRLNQTITEYLNDYPEARKMKVAIAAHQQAPYRLVYDILEVLDKQGFILSNIRMTKKSG